MPLSAIDEPIHVALGSGAHDGFYGFVEHKESLELVCGFEHLSLLILLESGRDVFNYVLHPPIIKNN